MVGTPLVTTIKANKSWQTISTKVWMPRRIPPIKSPALNRCKNRGKSSWNGLSRRRPRRLPAKAGRARQVKEHRRGEADRVDAVEHAAVAGDQRAVVFHAAVALDGRHGHAAGKAHDGDHQRQAGRLPRLERASPTTARCRSAWRCPRRPRSLPRSCWG